jgi:long-chain fatty acid transport protein
MDRTMRRLLGGAGAAAFAAAAGAWSAPAAAQGFYIPQQSVTGLGRSFAGEAAVARDASTIFYNPAGMTELQGREAVVGGNLILIEQNLTNRGSTNTLGAAVPGGESGNPYDPTLVPHLYVAQPFLERRAWVGLGLNAPFGLASDYGDNWFGRYNGTKTDLEVLNLSVTGAYRLTDTLSVGGGIDVQKADVTLERRIFTGATDAFYKVEGDDTAIGFNVGLLWKPLPTTRVGVHYRSHIDHDIEGDQTVSNSSSPLVPNGTVAGEAQLRLPDIVGIGVAHQLDERLTLSAGATWWRWSRFEEIDVQTTAGFNPPADAQNYVDSWQLAVGADYAWSDRITLRGGVAYYQTPVQTEFRSVRTPDGDRIRIGIGASYAIGESFVVDVAYAHIFVDDSTIDVRNGTAGANFTRAEAESSINIFGLALRYRF